MMTISVSAETVSKDGLDIALATDKESYSQDEEVTSVLTVNNTNDFAITNISLTQIIPEGFEIKENCDTIKQKKTLNAGETIELKVTYIQNDSNENDGKIDTDNNHFESDSDSGKNTSIKTSSGNSKPLKTSNTQLKKNTSDKVSSPATGDNNKLTLWIGLLGTATIIIVLLFKKKIWKKTLAIFLCLVTFSSVSVCNSVKAYAEETGPERINIKTIVTVDKKEVVIESIVQYDKILDTSSNEIVLDNLSTDETYFLVDREYSIMFTVSAKGNPESVDLCNEDNVIGAMHDDGLNGDASANDGIYSFILTTSSAEANSVDYYAKAGNTTSEDITIYYFDKPTETSYEEFMSVQEKLNEIENNHADDTGYVPEESKQIVMDEIEDYLDEAVADGIILLYEIEDYSVYIKLTSGLPLIFQISSEAVSADGTDVSLSYVSYQPSPDVASENVRRVTTEIAEYFDTNVSTFDSEEVTLDRIKFIGQNQVVVWDGHGYYGPIVKSCLVTGEKFDFEKLWNDSNYREDYIQERVVPRKNLACITSKFIDYYFEDLSNDLIVLLSCHSGRNERLANSFLNKGATAVFGFTNEVYTRYVEELWYNTMAYMGNIDSNSNNYYTLSNALAEAKQQVGDNDIIFAKGHPEIFKKIKSSTAEPIIFGGDKAENYRLANYTEHTYKNGDGSEENPYQVATAEDLDAVRNDLNANYIQVADIDMSSYVWQPIGDRSPNGESELYPFSGHFNGNGFKIKNLNINVKDNCNYVGLFGSCSEESSIENINIENLTISVDKRSTDYAIENITDATNTLFVGGITGHCKSLISNCMVSGKISVVNCHNADVGGITGSGRVKKSSNYADIYVLSNRDDYNRFNNGDVNCGGITAYAGTVTGNITGCINYGNIEVISGDEALCGGISGSEGTLKDCVNYGNIKGITKSHYLSTSCDIGGIIGESGSKIINSVNYGNVIGYAALGKQCHVGGIAGYKRNVGAQYGDIGNCFNVGKIINSTEQTKTNGEFVDCDGTAGRIVGLAYFANQDGYITNCYSVDSTLINGEIPSENIAANLQNGASLSETEITKMIQQMIETGTVSTSSLEIEVGKVVSDEMKDVDQQENVNDSRKSNDEGNSIESSEECLPSTKLDAASEKDDTEFEKTDVFNQEAVSDELIRNNSDTEENILSESQSNIRIEDPNSSSELSNNSERKEDKRNTGNS